MIEKMEEQLKKHQEDIAVLENRMREDVLLKERLVGAIVSIKQLLEQFAEPKKKKK